MGIVYTCDTHNKIVYSLWTGVIRGSDWHRALEKFLADPDWLASQRWLVDQTSITELSTFDQVEIQQGIEQLREHQAEFANDRIAIVANHSFSKASLISKLLGEMDAKTIVFNSLPVACVYLGMDTTKTIQILQRLRRELDGHEPDQAGLKVDLEWDD